MGTAAPRGGFYTLWLFAESHKREYENTRGAIYTYLPRDPILTLHPYCAAPASIRRSSFASRTYILTRYLHT